MEFRAEIRFKKLFSHAKIPYYAHYGDSGMDLCALRTYTIKYGECTVVETGLSAEVMVYENPYDFTFEVQVRPKSGLALNGITIINSPATIDQGYTGHWKFPLTKLTPGEFIILEGDKFAQAVICPVYSIPEVNVVEVDKLNETKRGGSGFGSTGL